MSNLGEIDFQGNLLSGQIPSEFGGLSAIGYLTLANNSLSGTVPLEFSALQHSLHTLDLQGNPLLSGTIPEALCDLNNTCVPTTWDMFGCDMELGLSFDCTGVLCGCGCPCEGGNGSKV